MNFNDKNEVALIHKHLDTDVFVNNGISLAWIETIRKYIECLETANKELTEENERLKKDTYTTEEVNTIREYERRTTIREYDNEFKKENEKLKRQLEPFKVKRCFTCSFYGVGHDHMPCYACQDYDKYKWLGDDIHVGDRVGTTKGRGVVSVVDNDIVTVELYGDHGIYCFSKDSVWQTNED